MAELFVGLMSGTSQDGLDAALVELDHERCILHAARTTPFPNAMATALATLIKEAKTELVELGTLDIRFGEFAAACVLGLLRETPYRPEDITAVGFSGHTVFHRPDPPAAFTLQIGDANTVAARTGITTVADLRGMDVALGGQGAPLLPAFHAWRFADPAERRVIVNLGGIANLTCLEPDRPATGFDSGPGNTLMNHWRREHGGGAFDRDGAWAATGKVVADLLRTLKRDPYFSKPPPKSTGLEHFNPVWLRAALERHGPIDPADVQATLLELTAATVAEATGPGAERLIVCGGGAYNKALAEARGADGRGTERGPWDRARMGRSCRLRVVGASPASRHSGERSICDRRQRARSSRWRILGAQAQRLSSDNGYSESRTSRLLHQQRARTARVQRPRLAPIQGRIGTAAGAIEISLHLLDESR